jgi:hypothetical protein
MTTLSESRIILKNLVDEFTEEQDEYKRQLEEITKRKEAVMLRRKGIIAYIVFFFLRKKFLYRKCNSTFNTYATKTGYYRSC